METNIAQYEVDLDDAWSIHGRPHGGYLLRQIADRALTDAHPHPMAVSAHYVRSPNPGPACVEVEVLRTGRRVSAARSRLSQGGQVCVEALVTTGRLDPAATPYWQDGSVPPDLAPLDQCQPAPATGGIGARTGHLDFIDLRIDATSSAEPTAEIRGWMRRMDGADATVGDLLVFADGLPPVTFGLGMHGWVPTVELTVLIRALPAPGWLRAIQRATLLQDGWIDESCELWDSNNQLVVQARQLAGYREPSA